MGCRVRGRCSLSGVKISSYEVFFLVKVDHLIPQTRLYSNLTVKPNFSSYAPSGAGIPNYKKSILFYKRL